MTEKDLLKHLKKIKEIKKKRGLKSWEEYQADELKKIRDSKP